MKKTTLTTLLLAVSVAANLYAQHEKSPYWVTETAKPPAKTLIHYYSSDGVLTYTEESDRRLNIRKNRTRKQLDRRLRVVFEIYEKGRRDGQKS